MAIRGPIQRLKESWGRNPEIISQPLLEQIHQQHAELTRTIQALEEANIRIEQMAEELAAARKIVKNADQIKTEFLAQLSHELRTPINAIINFAASVSDGLMGEVNEAQVERLQKLIDSGNHLLSLVDDVHDISKIEAGTMDLLIEEFDLNAVMNATVSAAKVLIEGKPIELITKIDDNLPTIHGDRRRISQVFHNLVSTALKFTQEGSITIAAYCAVDESSGTGKVKSEVHVYVRDTGIGIPAENYDLIFDAFRQADPDLRNIFGTGLGLPISRYIVEAHGGLIWVESEGVGSGATFHVVLPYKRGPVETAALDEDQNVPTLKDVPVTPVRAVT